VWHAPARSSVLMTVLLSPDDAVVRDLPMLAAVAVADAIEASVLATVKIKWPNDVLIDGRKVGGLLAERATVAGRSVALVGIGLNVNFDPAAVEGIPEGASSLQAANRGPVEREKLVLDLLTNIDARLAALRAGRRPFADWRDRLETLGKPVRVTIGERVLEGAAEGVDDDGRLLVRAATGELEAVSAGDVTLRR
jgi:BirA family biotin operon repressor/biotin-[acetyl-CoA-carboxylase] ligase